MRFDWTDEQLALKKAVLDFARSELSRRGHEQDHKLWREGWNKCAKFGILGLFFPQIYGGHEAGGLATALAMETLGTVCCDTGLLFALSAQMWSVQMPIWRFGTDAQKRRYLVPLIAGDLIGAHAMSEPESGSDAFSLRSTAQRAGDSYVLNGSKTFVTSAPEADLFLIFARLPDRPGLFGLTAFLVERSSGVRVGAPIHKMGLQGAPMAELYLDNCRVPKENRLGGEGQGARIFNDSMEWERTYILAWQIGVMERQIAETVSYAKERKVNGKPISGFQVVAHRIADMEIRLEAARLLLYRAAWLKAEGKAAAKESAIAKVYAAEAAVASALDAIQLHGGYGYSSDLGIECTLRDAVGGRIYSGTSEVLRNIISHELGL
ncbi:MAG: acyl-CoA dehydrogenase family protein [Acidobacteria bacterium]|nr:acyl-CoA dehydrogenase family protein [Acidobacteriota bacterium]